jgi:hypothetical protein
MANSKPLPPLEELKDAFDYDPETGLFTHARYKCGRALKGMAAGNLNKQGYVVIQHKRRLLKAHRMAWLLLTGEDPMDYQIDHIDRNRSNNQAANLRLVTPQQNRMNTEIKGYTKIGKRYRAQRWVDGYMIHIGMFDTPEEAAAAYHAVVLT